MLNALRHQWFGSHLLRVVRSALTSAQRLAASVVWQQPQFDSPLNPNSAQRLAASVVWQLEFNFSTGDVECAQRLAASVVWQELYLD